MTNNDEEFGTRMRRIQASLEKINNLMAALKAAKDEDTPTISYLRLVKDDE